MSLRGEIHDFVSTALAVSKNSMDRENSATRNKYYNALITNQTASQDMQKQRLDLAQREFASNADYRNRSLNQNNTLRQDQLALNTRAQDRADKEAQWRMNGSIPTGMDDGSTSVSPAFGGTGQVSPRINNTNPQTAIPAVGDAPTSSNVPAVTGRTGVAPVAAYDNDESVDEGGYSRGGAVKKYAGGGAVDPTPLPTPDPRTPDFVYRKIQDYAATSGRQPENFTGADVTKLQKGIGVTGGRPERQYATGGAVEDDNYEGGTPDTDVVNGSSGGGGGGGGGGGWADTHSTEGGFNTKDALDSWQSKPQGAVPYTTPQGAVNPVAIGMSGAPQAGAVPTQQPSLAAPATDEEIRAMNKAVDPKGELNESARTIARLDAGVKFYLAHGQPQKAAAMAQSLLGYGALQSSKFGQVASQAIQNGDMKSAIGYLQRAYDNIPDGRELTASVGDDGRVHMGVNDPSTGDSHDLGAFDAQQVYKLALGLQNGSEYSQRVQQIASGNFGKAPKAQTADRAMPVRDFNTLGKDVDTEFTNMVEARKLKLDLDTSSAIRNTALHMASDPNNRKTGMTPNEAVVSAAQIALPDPKDPKPNFKVGKPANGLVPVQFSDGRQVIIPQAQFDQLAAMRAAKTKAMQPPPPPKQPADDGVPMGDSYQFMNTPATLS